MANVLVWYRKHAFVYTHIYSNLKTILTLGEEEEASPRTNQSMPARCGCDFVSWITKDIVFIIIILVFCKTILSCQRYTIADFKICQYHVDGFTLKYVLLFELCAREICEKFVYKHSETLEYVKISILFKKFTNFKGW